MHCVDARPPDPRREPIGRAGSQCLRCASTSGRTRKRASRLGQKGTTMTLGSLGNPSWRRYGRAVRDSTTSCRATLRWTKPSRARLSDLVPSALCEIPMAAKGSCVVPLLRFACVGGAAPIAAIRGVDMEAKLCDAIDRFRDYLDDEVRSSVRSGSTGLGSALFLSTLIEVDAAMFRAAFGCPPPRPPGGGTGGAPLQSHPDIASGPRLATRGRDPLELGRFDAWLSRDEATFE